MNELEVIKYLIKEIEEEKRYIYDYREAEQKAVKEAETSNKYWWDLLPDRFKKRQPRHSIIRGNAKKIRQLLLKLY